MKKSQFFMILILGILRFLNASLHAQPIAYWPMNDGIGTTVLDILGGHNGTLNGLEGTEWDWTTGIVSGGLYFYGPFGSGTPTIIVPGHTDFAFGTGSFAISAWAKVDGFNHSGYGEVIIGVNWASSAAIILGFENSGQIIFRVQTGSDNFVVSNTIATTGRWYHIVGVRNAVTDQLQLFVNGFLENAVPDNSGSLTSTQNWSISGQYVWTGPVQGIFHGYLDEVMIFDTVLSPVDILSAYQNQAMTVLSTSPVSGTHSNNVSTDISATFDKNVQSSSVTDATFVAHKSYGSKLQAGEGTWGAAAATATLNPNADFKPGERVQMTATSGLFSTGGIPALPYVWQFHTATTGGHGDFGPAAFDAFGGGQSECVALGDVDGDGDLDAVVVNFAAAQQVWLNQGGAQGGIPGKFGLSSTFGAGQGTSIALGDLDGDGDLDAVLANMIQPNRVWLNQGGVQGGTPGDFGTSPFDLFDAGSSMDVTLGDLDGDGDLDAVVANFGQPNRVWLNQGGIQGGVPGDFGNTPFDTFDAGFTTCVELGDLDGDGDLDAVDANFNQPQRVFMNQGGAQGGIPGEFGTLFDAFGAGKTGSVALGDLDGDGDLDVVVANYLGQAQRVWLNQGGAQGGVAGEFTGPPADTFDAGQSTSVELGDLDGDGDLDVVVANDNEPQQVWLNQGGVQGGTAGEFGATVFDTFGDGHSTSVALGDVDGDGDLDAVVANYSDEDQEVWLNRKLDLGDLPAAYSLTTLADDGARHDYPRSGGIWLGSLIDDDQDGQESADAGLSGADGDDGDGTDDEDGVTAVGQPWREGPDGGQVEVVVTGGPGYLSAWIDWNGDNDFGDAGEQVFGMRPVAAGTQVLKFAIPAGTIPAWGTYEKYARFRLDDENTTAMTTTGLVTNGEVEDHLLQFTGQYESPPGARDFGDAPDPLAATAGRYPTLLVNDGARHTVDAAICLGAIVDGEADGQPDADSAGDDADGTDDEDGVAAGQLALQLGASPNITVAVTNTTGGPARLSGWIDYDRDGIFEASEKATAVVPAGAAQAVLIFPVVPQSAGTRPSHARFRISTDAASVAEPAGEAPDGEVEDYKVTFSAERVTLIYPNGGEVLKGGSNCIIRWTTFPAGVGTITLKYSTDGGLTYPNVIVSGTPNNGTYRWNRPPINSQTVRVMVELQHSIVTFDVSDGNLTIDSTPPVALLLSPNGGELWLAGTQRSITWTASDNFGLRDNPPPVSLRYTIGNDSDYPYLISEPEVHDGHYAWTVPEDLHSDSVRVKIKVFDEAGHDVCDESDGFFRVFRVTVTLTSFNGGELIKRGSDRSITWTSNIDSGLVTLRYSTDGGATYPNIIAAGEANDGSYPWRVQAADTDGFRIKIELDGTFHAEDESDGNSTVDGSPPEVTVRSPNGGESVVSGTAFDIGWTAEDAVGLAEDPISIFFSTDGGATYPDTIAAGEANDGTYTWNVPAVLSTAEARIRVEAVDLAGWTGSDASDDDFTIVQVQLALTSPNGDEVWPGGTEQVVAWAATDTGGTVSLLYSEDDGLSYPHVIGETLPNTGEYTWMTPETDCQTMKIKVIHAGRVTREDESNGRFAIDSTPPELSLLSMNGSEFLEAGGPADVRWEAADNVGFPEGGLSISYAPGAEEAFELIAGSLNPEDGLYTWHTPAGLRSEDVRLRLEVRDRAGYQTEASSSERFSVYPSAIQIEYPNGGEYLQGRSTQTIRWASRFASGRVTLKYTIDGGATYSHLITSDEANRGAFDWSLPGITSEGVRVKAILESYVCVEDESDGDFTIDYSQPSVMLIYPNGGEAFEANTTYRISWLASDPFGVKENSVNITFSTDGGYSYPHLIAEGTPNDSVYYWKTPSQLFSEHVRVRVDLKNASDLLGWDESDENVSLVNPAPRVSGLPDTAMSCGAYLYFSLYPYVTDKNDAPITLDWSWWVSTDSIDVAVNNQNKYLSVLTGDYSGTAQIVLTATDPHGASGTDTMRVTVYGETPVVSPEISIPEAYELCQNYPNPFNPVTTISYSLPEASEVSLRIYNLHGKEVEVLVSGRQAAGDYSVVWDALDCPSGTYIIRMQAKGFVQMRKCVLMK